MFLSRYTNKIDKKNRISVPASFRSHLNRENFNGVVLYPSFTNESIEGCSISRIQELGNIIDRLDPYSSERDAFETIILGGSIQLMFDQEGRVSLSKDLMEHAELKDLGCFIGKGQVFEIWNPEKFEAHLEVSKEIARKNRSLLKNNTT